MNVFYQQNMHPHVSLGNSIATFQWKCAWVRRIEHRKQKWLRCNLNKNSRNIVCWNVWIECEWFWVYTKWWSDRIAWYAKTFCWNSPLKLHKLVSMCVVMNNTFEWECGGYMHVCGGCHAYCTAYRLCFVYSVILHWHVQMHCVFMFRYTDGGPTVYFKPLPLQLTATVFISFACIYIGNNQNISPLAVFQCVCFFLCCAHRPHAKHNEPCKCVGATFQW